MEIDTIRNRISDTVQIERHRMQIVNIYYDNVWCVIDDLDSISHENK